MDNTIEDIYFAFLGFYRFPSRYFKNKKTYMNVRFEDLKREWEPRTS